MLVPSYIDEQATPNALASQIALASGSKVDLSTTSLRSLISLYLVLLFTFPSNFTFHQIILHIYRSNSFLSAGIIHRTNRHIDDIITQTMPIVASMTVPLLLALVTVAMTQIIPRSGHPLEETPRGCNQTFGRTFGLGVKPIEDGFWNKTTTAGIDIISSTRPAQAQHACPAPLSSSTQLPKRTRHHHHYFVTVTRASPSSKASMNATEVHGKTQSS